MSCEHLLPAPRLRQTVRNRQVNKEASIYLYELHLCIEHYRLKTQTIRQPALNEFGCQSCIAPRGSQLIGDGRGPR